MYALNDFKKMLGVEKIQLYKGDGRPFAQVGNHKIMVAEKINWNNPLFVLQGKYDAWWLCNSKASAFKEI